MLTRSQTCATAIVAEAFADQGGAVEINLTETLSFTVYGNVNERLPPHGGFPQDLQELFSGVSYRIRKSITSGSCHARALERRGQAQRLYGRIAAAVSLLSMGLGKRF